MILWYNITLLSNIINSCIMIFEHFSMFVKNNEIYSLNEVIVYYDNIDAA